MNKNELIVKEIRKIFKTDKFIPLHAPVFNGNEKKYLNECIDSTFVSYKGPFVTKFEEMMCEYTGTKYAIAMGNGTLALYLALLLIGVKQDEEVLTQDLTFVATANAISYCKANPVFIDSARNSLGMDPATLEEFLSKKASIEKNGTFNKKTGKRIAACLPVHIFGHPVEIDKINEICKKYKISLVEDAAESLGSYYKGKHTGLTGEISVLSFNGNKTVTTGGGGMVLTNNEGLASKAKHLSTTAKVDHPWEFYHDEVGFNYRMPNVNAAIGVAQMENLKEFLKNKRELATIYKKIFNNLEIQFITEPKDAKSNYWLNAIMFNSRKERDDFLEYSNKNGVMTRPAWTLMHKLPMYKDALKTDLKNAEYIEERLVNIPSSVRL